ncbi:Riboflavin synthase-like beta-barrel [Penicillium malachiteum]|uniref:Riboflavin synthase-like beta-barrel n=1 Tax=Penicillium malachiteum TaxID=1324776 RepID=UPI002547234A|nr:Riboflavin synthase-like beta-barrel [Penicillium malachiteum]KAJ5729814.1 Riboflavin synthase-like beta-barrel [Penicillium malachiteum]
MSSLREDSIPHELRTAAEPRQNRLYPVRLAHVEQVNRSIRLLQFAIPRQELEINGDEQQPFSFLPGQWLDVHIPSIPNAGGFTITSTPADAQILPLLQNPEAAIIDESVTPSPPTFEGREPYVELAVQDSPGNPAAAWLWKPKDDIIGKGVNIRVGGSFVWPPNGLNAKNVKNVVLIAGGVGINPLISILSHLNQIQNAQPLNVHFLYSSRVPQNQDTKATDFILDQILFLPRLRQIIRSQGPSSRLHLSLSLFLTNASKAGFSLESPADLTIYPRRIRDEDLRLAIEGQRGELDPQETVAYVCGPPAMTDELVEQMQEILGEGGSQRVFFEKWW